MASKTLTLAPCSQSWKNLQQITNRHLMSNTRLDGVAGIYELEMAKSIKPIHSSGNHAPVNLTDAVTKFISDAFCMILFGSIEERVLDLVQALHRSILLEPPTADEPEVFRPERFLGDRAKSNQELMIPFSAGRRTCPGMPIASRVVPFVVASLLHAFDWKSEGEIDLSERSSGTLSCMPASDLVAFASARLETSVYT
ncbi:cytochrome P450 76C1-like [Selaginella moellendorffii]|uniref:cytochrome P450 76C1-like n=1 Tax=Selaginella moellendorffii TaxID=88036 RepID=UPI000D1C9C9B|nr:cytochrome P450 76C1-like [Selaginella moellendorffii]|eukprot:XP_024539372.1 cytochrome P450 76C1-like [Selaginella moellendorffii]